MELYNIRVSNAGSPVNGYYSCVDTCAFGYSRKWRTSDDKYEISFKSDSTSTPTNGRWILIYGSSILYQLNPPTGTPDTSIPDPWSDKGIWVKINGIDPIPVVASERNANIVVTTTSTDKVTDSDGVVSWTETTTYRDTSTGSSTSEINNYKETPTYAVAEELTRTTTPNLEIGKVYRFRFLSPFQSLGYVEDNTRWDVNSDENTMPTNGVYRVNAINTWLQLLAGGMDVYTSLYVRAGVPRAMYEHDAKYFAETMFYTLQDPNNDDYVIYMPLTFIDGKPDCSVEEYKRLFLQVDMGYFSDELDIGELQDIVTNILLVKYGIKKDNVEDIEIVDPENPTEDELKALANCNTNVEIASIGSKFMDSYTFDKVREIREKRIAGGEEYAYKDVCYKDLLNRLFNQELNQTWRLNQKLLTQIECYERIIEDGRQIPPAK